MAIESYYVLAMNIGVKKQLAKHIDIYVFYFINSDFGCLSNAYK